MDPANSYEPLYPVTAGTFSETTGADPHVQPVPDLILVCCEGWDRTTPGYTSLFYFLATTQ